MKTKKDKPKILYASESAYLDPTGSGSMIGYRIYSQHGIYAEVDISDCNRKVTWYFEDAPEDVQKIDKAITMLTDFRDDLVAAVTRFKKG